MTSAHEWLKELLVDNGVQYSNRPLEAIIKKAQLDAMKEGMRRAACLLDNNYDMPIHDGPSIRAAAILTAAKQLTEKDLIWMKD